MALHLAMHMWNRHNAILGGLERARYSPACEHRSLIELIPYCSSIMYDTDRTGHAPYSTVYRRTRHMYTVPTVDQGRGAVRSVAQSVLPYSVTRDGF